LTAASPRDAIAPLATSTKTTCLRRFCVSLGK
jgi:hypothetical protein